MNELSTLAGEIGVSERTLRRATNQGTLRANRTGPRKLELSVSERVYVRRSWGLVSTLRSALRTESNVRFALLFGSAARGDDASSADVDVLVDLRDSSLERVVDVQQKLARATGREVDVVRLADAEADPSFLANTVADGRVLVDRDVLWPALRRREPRLRRLAETREGARVRGALGAIDRLLAG